MINRPRIPASAIIRTISVVENKIPAENFEYIGYVQTVNVLSYIAKRR